MKPYLALVLLAMCSCRAPIEPPLEIRIRRDLVGHTMGGDVQTWHFANEKQIVALTVLQQTNNQHIVVDLTLHDERVKPYYHAKALLTYEDKKLQTVGLLFIEQIVCGK